MRGRHGRRAGIPVKGFDGTHLNRRNEEARDGSRRLWSTLLERAMAAKHLIDELRSVGINLSGRQGRHPEL